MYGSGRSNVTLDEVDNFFKIEPRSSNLSTSSRQSVGVAPCHISTIKREIPTAKSRGYLTDSTGRKVELLVEDEDYLPKYLRQNVAEYDDDDYAKIYQEQENYELLQEVVTGPADRDDVSIVAGGLHDIDLDSVYSDTSRGFPEHLVPHFDIDVYERYDFHHEYNDRLPITAHQQTIVRTIESNPVTVIRGSTGSGKTTQVPQYILDYYVDMGRPCNIVVTQPRRIAARAVAARVCNERDWPLGTVCGYQVGMDDPEMSEDTRLLYVTTGTLLQKLITAKNMDNFTHVVIDEVHERDQDTDFLLVVVRKMLRTKSRNVKVILMSATMDCELFVRYFLVPVAGELETAPMVSVEGKMFNVSVYYLEDIRTLGPLPKIEPDNPCVTEEAQNLAYKLILYFDELESKELGVSKSGFAASRGSVLVFLPGLYEIECMHQRLNEVQNKHKLTLIPLHSTISIIEQAKVFEPPAHSYRKVILSTNIAESSITVPDIKYVIDFCLTKHLIADRTTSYTSLRTQWCSKSSSNQRKGRSGRVANGRVYRMVTGRFWNDHLMEYGVPEMQRCPLPHVVLNVKRLDLGEPKAILALCISPPNLDDIGKTILLLRVIGALRASANNSPHDGELTFLGRCLSQLPLDVRLGKLLIMGFVFGVLKEALVIAAGLSLKSVFTKPFMRELEAYRTKLMWSAGQFCDGIAILETYQMWQEHHATGYFKRSGNSEQAWCRKNSLQLRRLQEIQRLIDDLTHRLARLNIVIPQEPEYNRGRTNPADNSIILKVAMCGAFYPNYFIQQPLDEDNVNRTLSGHDPMRTVVVSGLPSNQGILYKDTIEEQFRDCDNQLPLIHFEESKAYIEFASDYTHSTGKVHPGVYAAVKKRLLKKMLEIQLYSAEETNKHLQEIEALALQETSKFGRLRTHRLTAVGPQDSLSIPSGVQSVIKVVVTEVIKCGHFWVQIETPENYKHMSEIVTALNQTVLQKVTRPLKSGLLVAAPYSDSHNPVCYYRAQLYDVPTNAPGRINWVQVFFVDFGNRATVQVTDLRHLNDDLQLKPFQAVECFLSELRPSIAKCPSGEWSRQATRAFSEMVAVPQGTLLGVIYSQVGTTLRLRLVDKRSDGRQLDINSELVRLGFAEKCEEQLASRQNHAKRTTEANSSTHHPSVPSDFLSLSVDNMSRGKRRGRKITLRGPVSPLEMSFMSLTNAGRMREVRIEQGSVNQVALDDDPSNPMSRLMIASFVGLSPTMGHMLAHNTTILPHIPGLPALVALLFTPKAEMRVDPKKTRLIGAICGLGAEEDSNVPIFPDDDMEVTFDTKITRNDLSKINGVRMAMNLAVGVEDTTIAWGYEAIDKIQMAARNALLTLLKKKRQPMEMCYYKRPYHWNMVAPEDEIPYGEDIDGNQFYQLHSSVRLSGREDGDDDDEDNNTITS